MASLIHELAVRGDLEPPAEPLETLADGLMAHPELGSDRVTANLLSRLDQVVIGDDHRRQRFVGR